MLRVIATSRFKRDSKRMFRRGKDPDKIEHVIRFLAQQRPLEARRYDHKLSGMFEGRRECHIEPDWLLIYLPTTTELILERTGTHSDLFE
jgi:mRNA interferase YafQ